MKKAYALMLLVAVAVACDPWIEDCTPQEDLPSRPGLINKWWMHGILNWFMGLTPMVMFAIYAISLTELGVVILAVTYIVGALNFIGYVLHINVFINAFS